MVKKIIVMASGRGTDFQAIVDHQKLDILRNVKIAGMVCNHRDSPVIGKAQSAGIESIVVEGITGRKFSNSKEREISRREFDNKCLAKINEIGIDLVVLAGFDQILGSDFVDSCKFKILNIHPAYNTEMFGGKNMVGRKVHELVLKNHSEYSGCTVHFVTNDIDLGPVVLKKRLDIGNGETPESLEKRILYLEHLAYPEGIQLVTDDRVQIDATGKRCFVDRYSGNWDIEWNARQKRYIDNIQKE